MKKAMVLRAGKGMGRALTGSLIEAGAEVVAFSGSRRRLTALEEAYSGTSRLRTALGDGRNPQSLLTAAAGVDAIFIGVYLTYDEHPDRVRERLEAVHRVSERTGAKVVLLEGIYRPDGENEDLLSGKRHLRLLCPELYGPNVSNTIVHYTLKRIAQGKTAKYVGPPSVKREYLYADDAARDAAELAMRESADAAAWRLRGGPAISASELIGIAGSAVHAVPSAERIGGWKLKLLEWREPRAKDILNRYRQGDSAFAASLPEYGSERTPYESGIAATLARISEKLGSKTSIRP
ncbi:hypothetical protein [Cohnella hongkongensis]|uniref:Uncharacterized protein n=1 Tax=Cohnella hongkongensis TaxID=178337 RepID=A0ABV9FEB2_9BACL